ncbi:class I SAM-dependent RNA methyltransferase [Wenyingzhuangia sp. 2_MG-2023]|uniref:THUMP domain-containing class I SAM-dependent RNA methyltransferase n=1 Tax=Wenyingzhuangia sp. 2_MG-2023 TaxID=3062639 RepID=UPI0026E20C36|nr:THUMP domain-containing protein [Wenyingzhuangia sp. 2_MG-2023]MDO6738531.1 THUMP domain-containing protein [Wenyingzhuangia sp. 2_MG-2023]
MGDNFKMVAITLQGLEEVLSNELKQLGAQDVKSGVRMVEFVGDEGFMYKANLYLRTAIRILKPIVKFKVRNEDDFYKNLLKIRWEKYVGVKGTFATKGTNQFTGMTDNTHYLALRTKDAIADYFMAKYEERPNVDVKHPDLKVNVHIDRHGVCTVSLDSSGDSLHKRGYRLNTNIAPINEVLAAGLILLSGYNGDQNFIDPMCGSGTLLIEAAMIACNIPANINRKEFAFEKWNDYNENLFFAIQDSLIKRIRDPKCKIMGFDKAPSAVVKANENIQNANLEEFIGVHHVNFFNSKKEVFGPTTILFNPPYGERLKLDDTEGFYRSIGDTLKHHYHNSSAWFITSDVEALKFVGLKTSRRIAIKNSDLDCKFVKYEIYEGSKKAKKNDY